MVPEHLEQVIRITLRCGRWPRYAFLLRLRHTVPASSRDGFSERAIDVERIEPAFDAMLFKRKAVSIHHELMFTRAIYETPDMGEQGRILDEVAALVDAGHIRSTLTETLSPINAANLRKAHAAIETGTARGKLVLQGF